MAAPDHSFARRCVAAGAGDGGTSTSSTSTSASAAEGQGAPLEALQFLLTLQRLDNALARLQQAAAGGAGPSATPGDAEGLLEEARREAMALLRPGGLAPLGLVAPLLAYLTPLLESRELMPFGEVDVRQLLQRLAEASRGAAAGLVEGGGGGGRAESDMRLALAKALARAHIVGVMG